MTSRAAKLYSAFHDEPAGRTVRTGVRFGREWITAPGDLNILIPSDLMIIGRLNAVEYDCRRGNRLLKARHVFAPGSRPALASGTKNGQLFILGTRYRMTERGIVDLNARGDALDFDEDTGKIRKLR